MTRTGARLSIPGKSMFRLSPQTRLRILFSTLLALAWFPASGHAVSMHHPHKMLKQQVEDLEQQWRTATLSGDVGVMDHLLAEDYVGISWTGQVNTKAMQLDRIRTRSFQISRLDLIDSKIKLLGNVAIVTARAEIEGSTDGVPMTGTFRYTRVYQRLPTGDWQITNFEATRVPDPGEHPHHGHPGPQ